MPVELKIDPPLGSYVGVEVNGERFVGMVVGYCSEYQMLILSTLRSDHATGDSNIRIFNLAHAQDLQPVEPPNGAQNSFTIPKPNQELAMQRLKLFEKRKIDKHAVLRADVLPLANALYMFLQKNFGDQVRWNDRTIEVSVAGGHVAMKYPSYSDCELSFNNSVLDHKQQRAVDRVKSSVAKFFSKTAATAATSPESAAAAATMTMTTTASTATTAASTAITTNLNTGIPISSSSPAPAAAGATTTANNESSSMGDAAPMETSAATTNGHDVPSLADANGADLATPAVVGDAVAPLVGTSSR